LKFGKPDLNRQIFSFPSIFPSFRETLVYKAWHCGRYRAGEKSSANILNVTEAESDPASPNQQRCSSTNAPVGDLGLRLPPDTLPAIFGGAVVENTQHCARVWEFDRLTV